LSTRPRALVADDDVAIRVLVSRILVRHGFEVDAVPDGAAALEHILQHAYDVIVLDLMMPRVDGFKVIDYLTESHPELLKHVIVMTAYGATGLEKVPATIERVEKPFEVSSLAKKAKALLAVEANGATMDGDAVDCETS
jgi:two-component system cell cycle sensor histidine kinase/response regulator CckA